MMGSTNISTLPAAHEAFILSFFVSHLVGHGPGSTASNHFFAQLPGLCFNAASSNRTDRAAVFAHQHFGVVFTRSAPDSFRYCRQGGPAPSLPDANDLFVEVYSVGHDNHSNPGQKFQG